MKRRHFLNKSATTAAILGSPIILKAAKPEKIKIGQIGLTHPHARGKLGAIQQLQDIFEIVGVVEPNTQLQRKVKEVKFISEAELLDTKGLQAIAVETSVRDLVPTAAKAIAAGCHIHLDKPAGPSLEPFQNLVQNAKSRKLTIQMGYMLRYNPAFAFMFKAVKEGWFGEIMEIDAMMGKKANTGLRKELSEFHGGGFFELACHILDAAIYILGKPVSAKGYNLRTLQDSGDNFADSQLAVLEYPKATACLRCNHNDPFGFPRRRFNISGTKGGMEIQQLESGKFTLYLDQPRENYKKGAQVVQLKGGRSYVPEFQDLANVIRGEKELDWTYDHDLLVQETLLQISEMQSNK